MFALKKIISALVLPPLGLVLVVAMGMLLSRRWPRVGRSLAWGGLIMLLLLATPIVSNSLLNSLEDVPVLNPAAARQAQAIVVLAGGRRVGAAEYGGDTVSFLSLERARYAAWLARRTGLPVMVSGGVVFSGPPEALLLARVLQEEYAVKVSWIEPHSRDTHQNAQFSAGMLREKGITKVLLVTHVWHMHRAQAEFSAAGMQTIAAATGFSGQGENEWIDFIPSSAGLWKSHLAAHELLGAAVQKLTAGNEH